MSPARAWWLLLAPGGLVLAPLVWFLLRRRAKRRSRFVGEPLRSVDLTGLRRAPSSPEERS